MTLERSSLFWLIIGGFFALIIWMLSDTLQPFVAGMAIAYFLDPLVEKISGKRIPRWLASLLVLLAFCTGIFIIGLMIAPLLRSQSMALITALPDYIDKIQTQLLPQAKDFLHQFAPSDSSKLEDAASQSLNQAASIAGSVMKHLLSSGSALINLLILLVLTPIVAFFMLLDWPVITKTIDSLIPRKSYDIISEQLKEIDGTLSGFLRGQALVCLALGIYNAIGLTLIGIPYGVTIGVVMGVLSFIPMAGSLFGWVITLALCFAHFTGWTQPILVVALFTFGNLLESYFLTPKLVGDRIGLHPLWIMFALIAGGKLMGFTGVLIAVPVAAIIGVLVRFSIRQYKGSRYYEHRI